MVVKVSLDKAIKHKKEHRKKYHGAKSIDRTCRNHGSCDWCKLNRKYSSRKRKMIADEKIKEYYNT